MGGHGLGGCDWKKANHSVDDFCDPGSVLLSLLLHPLLVVARHLVARPVLRLTLAAAIPLTPAS